MRTRTKALVAGGAAVVVLATGGVAVASESATTAGHGQPSGTTHTGQDHSGRHHADRIEHGQFVSKDAAGHQVTHDIVDGTVTAVSGTSIAVKDGTGTTTTFTVEKATKVEGATKGSTIAIGAVKTGQHVTVQGTGTGPFVATKVRER